MIKNGIQLKKKKKAIFFSYVYYENGKDLIGKFNFSFCKPKVIIQGNKPQKDKIVILDGIYTFCYPFGEKQKTVTLYYEEGILVKEIWYNESGGKSYVYAIKDYKEKFKNIPSSYSFTRYSFDGKVLEKKYIYYDAQKNRMIILDENANIIDID